jgi:hypothetical protein
MSETKTTIHEELQKKKEALREVQEELEQLSVKVEEALKTEFQGKFSDLSPASIINIISDLLPEGYIIIKKNEQRLQRQRLMLSKEEKKEILKGIDSIMEENDCNITEATTRYNTEHDTDYDVKTHISTWRSKLNWNK